jgi:predicted transcriptional regulator
MPKKRDNYGVLLNALGNPTKLSIVFLLTHQDKMTVTQMAKHVGLTKANLYHFVRQMVTDGLLSKPESVVKENYVEKYYRLNAKLFESINPSEQRKRLKAAPPAELKIILQSALASLGLDFRLLAEEIDRADNVMLEQIVKSVAEERITLSYSILSDKAYEYVLGELKRVHKLVEEKWRDEKGTLKGNRLVIVGLPQFRDEVISSPSGVAARGTTKCKY